MTWQSWREDVPADWQVVPLRAVAAYRVSNVDKLKKEDELPVRLCNYVDVYHNEFIDLGLDFMEATATPEEIQRFKVRRGDVIITKDSESWDDIAVPALVRESARDLVCGYHLAQIRPRADRLDGAFLFRCLQAKPIRLSLELAANGVTRFGLPKSAIGDTALPVPPLASQRAIADFLDTETAHIDALIAAKQDLLDLLAEKRRALIIEAVTRGLDPDVPMKDSGVPWLGEIPAHWVVEKARWLFRLKEVRSNSGEEELLTVSHITGVTPRSEKEVNMFEAASTVGYKVCNPGDLVINTMWAWMGAMGVAPCLGIVSPSYHVYEVGPNFIPGYIDELVRTQNFADEVARYSKGVWSSRLRLYPEGFLGVHFPVPPVDEQFSILESLRDELSRIDRLSAAVSGSLTFLQERREALIAAAVNGQLDLGDFEAEANPA